MILRLINTKYFGILKTYLNDKNIMREFQIKIIDLKQTNMVT